MKNIVITGSTRGIGFSLANAFLASGCRVVISGRKQPTIDVTVKKLRAVYGSEAIFGFACDVKKFE